MQNNFVNKMSSYNLFNIFLPGIIFIFFVLNIFNYNISNINFVSFVFIFFLAYFIGIVLSRIGSIVIEPLLKKIGFIKFIEYSYFLEAVKIDKKINTLVEENNVYRTYISLFFILILLYVIRFVFNYLNLVNLDVKLIILILFFILFLFSYKKQTFYITVRVKKNKK